jgi:cytochrome P450
LDRRCSADRISPFRDYIAADSRERLKVLLDGLGLWAVFNDPPDHSRRRALMAKAFTSRAVDGLAPMIEGLVDRLLDAAVERGRIDLIADFAYPLPATVIAAIVGVGAADIDRVKRWSDGLATFVGSAIAVPDRYDRAVEAMREFAAYVNDLVDDRRNAPKNDLISDLLAVEDRGARLTPDEIVQTCVLATFAGHETTTNLIGNGMLALLRNPDQLERLHSDLTRIETAVEEFMRYDGPAQAVTRIAREPIAMHGFEIARGDRIFIVLNAADRDPRQFSEPDRLDVSRADNRHVAFGHGAHFCLGAPLARLEGQVAFRRLLTRFRALEPIAEPEWHENFVLRGVKRLDLRFRPA